MLNCLLVGLGGFIGAVLRYLISLIPIKNPESFPINTFIINIIGAFAIGCIAFAVSKNENIDPTFSLETAELIKGGSVLTAVIYVIFSIVVGVLAVMLPQLGLK